MILSAALLCKNCSFRPEVSVVSNVGEGTLSDEFTAHSCANPSNDNVVPTRNEGTGTALTTNWGLNIEFENVP